MRLAILIAMILLMTVGALSTVAAVGKPRKPLTGGQAALVVAVLAAEIIGLYYLYASAS